MRKIDYKFHKYNYNKKYDYEKCKIELDYYGEYPPQNIPVEQPQNVPVRHQNIYEANLINLPLDIPVEEPQNIPQELQNVRVQDHQNEDENKNCCVCLSNPKDTLLLPCKHLCACFGCSEHIIECPLCRKPIESKINGIFICRRPATFR